jgi:hypothetical protein
MNKHGDFIWYELLTSDIDAAGAFYAGVIGWTMAGSGQPGVDYRILSSDTGAIAGAMQILPQMAEHGARPGWLGYLGVDDVDASVESVSAAGGAVHTPPMTMEGVGRMAMVADPQGAPFYVMRGASDQASLSFAWDKPRIGHCAWNELATADPDAAKAFYAGQFGWMQDGEMPMGEIGSYAFMRGGSGVFGAVMPKQDGMPASSWTYYFRVTDIDIAAAAIAAGGGAIVQPPVEIPGGDYSLVATDPQGATFGLVGARS